MPVRGRGIDLDTNYIARAAIAAEVNVVATTSAGGTACITTGAFTVENAGTYVVEVFSPYLTLGTTNLDLELWDGATLLTTLAGHMAVTIPRPGSSMMALVTLSQGGHNLTVKGFVDGGTGKFGANNGLTGNAPNALIFVYPA